ncbi:MAG: hypothetical protein ACLFPQ_04960 [Candidatus Woesearchaeota archaeon]
MKSGYLEQDSSYGYGERVVSTNPGTYGKVIPVSLDTLIINNYPLFKERLEKTLEEAKEAGNYGKSDYDDQLDLFSDPKKKEAKDDYSKAEVMKQLDEVLRFRFSQVSCDSCPDNPATKLIVPDSYQTRFNFYKACDDDSLDYEGRRYDLTPESLNPKTGKDIRAVILKLIGFTESTRDDPVVNFKNAHNYFRDSYDMMNEK